LDVTRKVCRIGHVGPNYALLTPTQGCDNVQRASLESRDALSEEVHSLKAENQALLTRAEKAEVEIQGLRQALELLGEQKRDLGARVLRLDEELAQSNSRNNKLLHMMSEHMHQNDLQRGREKAEVTTLTFATRPPTPHTSGASIPEVTPLHEAIPLRPFPQKKSAKRQDRATTGKKQPVSHPSTAVSSRMADTISQATIKQISPSQTLTFYPRKPTPTIKSEAESDPDPDQYITQQRHLPPTPSTTSTPKGKGKTRARDPPDPAENERRYKRRRSIYEDEDYVEEDHGYIEDRDPGPSSSEDMPGMPDDDGDFEPITSRGRASVRPKNQGQSSRQGQSSPVRRRQTESPSKRGQRARR